MDERKMIYLEDAIKAVCDEFTTVYCYNCANQESEDQCEWCHRKSMNWSVSRNTVKRILNNLPSAQPERKRGEWIPVTNGRGGFECSKCHDYAPSYQNGDDYLSHYCPNCGADMRGGKSE